MSHRKTPEERQRRNKPRYVQHILTDDGVKRGPNLPEYFVWHPQTVSWYEDFRVSPNAQLCEDTDWESVLIAALLHNRLWTGMDLFAQGAYKAMTPAEMTSLSGELRRRMAPYGYTNEDRLRLNVYIESGDPDEQADTVVVKGEVIDYAALLADQPMD